ncbi:MAG: hypothetical protein K6E13_03325 [Lachnospiraceae bacterium]|nr:hypothetical protein [Lachnospiraceae bacterium]
MSYEEWKNAKSESQSITAGVQRAKEYKQSYVNEYKNPKGLGANSDTFGIVAPHDPPKHIDTIDFNNPDAVKSILNSYENRARSLDHETACVITTEGKVYECYGIKDRVWVDADLGDELKGAIVSHNHHIDVTEFSLGSDDMSLFASYELKELHGCDEKYTHILSRINKTLDPLPEDWMNVENYQHATVVMWAERYGYGYVRVQND